MGYSWRSNGVTAFLKAVDVDQSGARTGHQTDRGVDNSAQQRGVIVLSKLVILETMQSLRVLEAGRLKERKKKRKKKRKKRGRLEWKELA
jgi:hypothetical protein